MKSEQGAVVEPGDAVPRGVRADHGRAIGDATAFFGQDTNALDRMATEFARVGRQRAPRSVLILARCHADRPPSTFASSSRKANLIPST